jgi:hypothetical protein
MRVSDAEIDAFVVAGLELAADLRDERAVRRRLWEAALAYALEHGPDGFLRDNLNDALSAAKALDSPTPKGVIT